MASPNTPKPVNARCGGPAQKSLRDAFCDVIERDDGKWSIGFVDDAAGPFESREFALRVASGFQPLPAPTARFCRISEVRRHARTT